MDSVIFKGIKYPLIDGELNLIAKGIIDINEIEGIKNLTNLKILNLNNNEISEIKNLENLTELRILKFNKNKLTEIKGLEILSKLEVLSLHNNNIEEINGLENLINLKELDLSENFISEIIGLNSLNKLEVLNLGYNQIDEIKNLEYCVNLKELWFEENQISEVKGLDNLTDLISLNIAFNNILESTGLEKLIKLKILNLESNNIKKIKGIRNQISLDILNLNGNQIEKIEDLNELKKLKELYLSENKIRRIEGLDNLINLERLILSSNYIKKIEGLDNFSNLKTLSLCENEIEKIESLNKINTLESLLISDNEILEIEELLELLNLNELDISGNKIKAIDGLHKLENLYELDLSDNRIKEIKGLEKLRNLNIIYLKGNDLKPPDDKWINFFTSGKQIVNYCRQKKRGIIENKFLIDEKTNHKETIKAYKKELQKLEKSQFVEIGTHNEKEKIRYKQNELFFERTPVKKILSRKNYNLVEITIALIQIHSLKGIRPLLDVKEENYNRKYFNFFLRHFWNNEDIENNVLVYGDFQLRINNKIDEFFDLCLKTNHKQKPNLIIFPENSIPCEKIKDFISLSEKHNLMIIGGVEHIKTKTKHYLNIAIIIDKGKISYQIKQTPVGRENKENNEYEYENIFCQKIPKIKIFETTIGNIAVLVCKDFLRLSDIISDWAWINDVDLIIIPSLTSKVLPFYAKLLTIFNYTDYKNLKIIFNNVGEYGGSELFTINNVKQIEDAFRRNIRDNVGEIVVTRKCEI